MEGDQPMKRTRAKRHSRSRTGCPECRSRKIKCDEKQPKCGQCLKSGRVCSILDSIFKPHSYSFQTAPVKQGASGEGQSREKTSGTRLPFNNTTGVDVDGDQAPTTSGSGTSTLPRQLASPFPANDHDRGADYSPARPTDFGRVAHILNPGPSPVEINRYTESPARQHESPRNSATTIQAEDSYQDRCEIAFFLRHFAEGPGQWMDVCGGQSYFSQNAVTLSHWSPLVRYAACALGAKQLGQTRHPELQIRQTNTQSLMMKALIDTKLGFTWYGAKYYERAIQLLAKKLSKKDSTTYSSSPNCIYGLSLTPKSVDHNTPSEREGNSFPFQILAACILCQYEDVNATIRAWSGHLDGVFRLLRPHVGEPASFQISDPLPQPVRALDAVFWFVVVNDMLNAFVVRRKTRIDPDDLVIWRKMGLPLDDHGHSVTSPTSEAQLEIVLFKALVRIMCRLFNADLTDSTQWSLIDEEFDRWQGSVPSSFYIPITWPPVDASPTASFDPFSRETWFASEVCAITLAFYHMARMILLANRPIDLSVRPRDSNNLLGAYNTLQQDLRKHAVEIIPIMHAMPNETVQKYMLQPLYVAGRSLTDDKERGSLLQMLRDMGDDFGLFTDYRIQDLCEEWGIPYDGIDRRDGHGILT
ncbi:uncharacterized protein BDV17DRAFT_203626 [Aspergillus undulatus]|uniref:uncharacterized protein n=1 Tax=Aspergillus undulatus TaxID=1810928 RepID=UPI003CCDE9E8